MRKIKNKIKKGFIYLPKKAKHKNIIPFQGFGVAEAEADVVGVTAIVGLGEAVGALVGFLVGLGLVVADGVEVGEETTGEGDINITLIVESEGSGETSDLFLKKRK